MTIAVIHWDFRKVERRHSFKTGDVYSDLTGVRAAFVMRVYSTDRAEMMFSDTGVEPVAGEFVRAAFDCKLRRIGGHGHCTAHPADRAAAAPRG